MDKRTFEERIKPMLQYVGTIGAVLFSIMYIIVITIIVLGFHVRQSLGDLIIFACVNAAFGFIIMQFLKIQGISIASHDQEYIPILEAWNALKVKKTKKPRTLKYYWIKSVIQDILTKGVTIALSTIGVIYIGIQGSNDYILMLLAVANLGMFLAFGFLAMNGSFVFFCNEQIPYIKLKLEEQSIVYNRQQTIQELGGGSEVHRGSGETNADRGCSTERIRDQGSGETTDVDTTDEL